MAYTTEATIRKQSPFKNTQNITSDYIALKISEASSIIDGYIGKIYTLPLSSTPSVIAAIAEALATLLIFSEQSKNVEVEPGVSIEAAWQQQIEMLEAIRDREISLIGADGLELPLVSSKKLGFYPNQASSDAGYTAPYFTMDQTF